MTTRNCWLVAGFASLLALMLIKRDALDVRTTLTTTKTIKTGKTPALTPPSTPALSSKTAVRDQPAARAMTTHLPPLRPADPLPTPRASDTVDRLKTNAVRMDDPGRAEYEKNRIIREMEARAKEADDPIAGMERRAQVADNPVARMEQRAKAQDDPVVGMNRRMSASELARRLEARMDAARDPAKNLERRMDVVRDPANRLEQRMNAQRDPALNLQRRLEVVEGLRQPAPTGPKPTPPVSVREGYKRAVNELGRGINIRYGYEDDPIR